eukprot:SM001119S24182  [mRNA]  locus=s1119:764:2207:+ [translate_table: standard]
MHPPRKRKKTPVWGPTASQSQALKGLLAVKAAFANGHARGPLSTWVGANPCSGAWTGVTCEAGTPVGASGTELLVSGLDLNGFGLQGPLPGAALLQLKDLGFLHASHVSTSPPCTSAARTLRPLQMLYLHDIPWQSSCPSCDAGRARLSGPLDPGLGALVSSQVLDLSANSLTGDLPSVAKLSNLVRLNIASNQLDGNITNSDVFHLPRLQSLVYSQNRFTGLPPADTSVPFIDGSACDSGAANGTFVTVDQVYRIGNLTCHHFVIQAPSPPPPRAPGSPPDSSRTP